MKPDLPRTALALRIIDSRKRLALKQEDLAVLAGVKLHALADLERGKTKDPRSETLRKIADVLKVSLDYLLGRPVYPLRKSAPPQRDSSDASTEVYGRTA